MRRVFERAVEEINAFANRMMRPADSAVHESDVQVSSRESVEMPQRPFRVGDYVHHPLRDEITPVLAVGDRIWRFQNVAYVGKSRSGNVGAYEVIEGSPGFYELQNNTLFVGAHIRTQPSIEVDLSHDIEKRTLVVPVDHIQRATEDEVATAHSRAEIARLQHDLLKEE